MIFGLCQKFDEDFSNIYDYIWVSGTPETGAAGFIKH